jgi:hypothetical protein
MCERIGPAPSLSSSRFSLFRLTIDRPQFAFSSGSANNSFLSFGVPL